MLTWWYYDLLALLLPNESKQIWDSLEPGERRWIIDSSWRARTHEDPAIARLLADMQSLTLARIIDAGVAPRWALMVGAIVIVGVVVVSWATAGPMIAAVIAAVFGLLLGPPAMWLTARRRALEANRQRSSMSNPND